MFLLQGTWIQSLVEDLRSFMPLGTKKKKKNYKCSGIYESQDAMVRIARGLNMVSG